MDIDFDFSSFEPLLGNEPFQILSRHPDGELIALQAFVNHPQSGGSAEFSAIWDLHSRDLVWMPENVNALAWNADGTEIGLIRDHYEYNGPAHLGIIGSPLQSEFTYIWERRSWPGKELISSCPIFKPTGWPVAVAISPRGNLALFQWRDQCESGLEFITLTDDGDFQLLDTGLPLSTSVRSICLRPGGNGFPVGSQVTALPVFSPDGQYVVFCWQYDMAWWEDLLPGEYVTDETSAKVGECRMGFIEIIDWDARAVQQIPVNINLPSGWRPTMTRSGTDEWFRNPVFIDNEHFQLLLPTGETRVYSVQDGE